MSTFTINLLYYTLIGLIPFTVQQQCDLYKIGVTSKEKQQILQEHNKFRSLIMQGEVPNQPKGYNLKKLTWDDCLAEKAQDFANTCIYDHMQAPGCKWAPFGQNIYRQPYNVYNTTTDWPAAVKYWFDEYKLYTYGQEFALNTGHYTQVIWADTYKVGCGYSLYNNGEGTQYKALYFCNYGPPGNVDGQNPYPTSPS